MTAATLGFGNDETGWIESVSSNREPLLYQRYIDFDSSTTSRQDSDKQPASHPRCLIYFCPRNGGSSEGMGSELSMATRTEITTKYAKEYKKASRKTKSTILNEVIAVTGWTRDNARRCLSQAAKHPPGPGRQVRKRPRKPRAQKYSYDAVKILQRVWAISGGQCGKYLHATMRILLHLLEAHHELIIGQGRYTTKVRRELLTMSPATIDRYLKPIRAKDAINGHSTTKPGTLLRSAITIRRAGDDVEDEPGFFEGDTVAHCGPVESGEFARTLNLTDFHTGWTYTRTVRNNAHTNILAGLKSAAREIPFAITGLDFDNGSEFLNQYVIEWAGSRGIYFTRSRPYKKNDRVEEQPRRASLRVLLPLRH